MQVYTILDNGMIVNRIVADEAFCREYCIPRGLTWQLEGDVPEPEPAPIPEPTYSAEDMIKALIGA